MTLNIAHGRGDSFHQLLQRSVSTLANLDAIASMFRENDADIVALQEADGPSFWSGNFDHVGYIAAKAGFARSAHGMHVDGLGLSYGTALISNLELKNTKAVTFDPALSPIPKGFVVSTINWPGNVELVVDIVSVHLDFTNKAIRRMQAMELIDTLKQRKNPMILMGDFNAGWQRDSVVRHISQALGLSAYHPTEPGLETFPAFGERLDWILVSPEISFRSYQVLPDKVSDHRGVIAELEWRRRQFVDSDDISCVPSEFVGKPAAPIVSATGPYTTH